MVEQFSDESLDKILAEVAKDSQQKQIQDLNKLGLGITSIGQDANSLEKAADTGIEILKNLSREMPEKDKTTGKTRAVNLAGMGGDNLNASAISKQLKEKQGDYSLGEHFNKRGLAVETNDLFLYEQAPQQETLPLRRVPSSRLAGHLVDDGNERVLYHRPEEYSAKMMRREALRKIPMVFNPGNGFQIDLDSYKLARELARSYGEDEVRRALGLPHNLPL